MPSITRRGTPPAGEGPGWLWWAARAARWGPRAPQVPASATAASHRGGRGPHAPLQGSHPLTSAARPRGAIFRRLGELLAAFQNTTISAAARLGRGGARMEAQRNPEANSAAINQSISQSGLSINQSSINLSPPAINLRIPSISRLAEKQRVFAQTLQVLPWCAVGPRFVSTSGRQTDPRIVVATTSDCHQFLRRFQMAFGFGRHSVRSESTVLPQQYSKTEGRLCSFSYEARSRPPYTNPNVSLATVFTDHALRCWPVFERSLGFPLRHHHHCRKPALVRPPTTGGTATEVKVKPCEARGMVTGTGERLLASTTTLVRGP